MMRSTENAAFDLISARASRGITPSSACTSHTAISTSSHFRNLFSSDQTAPISGNVYLSIISGKTTCNSGLLIVQGSKFQVHHANLETGTSNQMLQPPATAGGSGTFSND